MLPKTTKGESGSVFPLREAAPDLKAPGCLPGLAAEFADSDLVSFRSRVCLEAGRGPSSFG